MLRISTLAVLVLTLATPGAARAHDYWVQPSSFAARVGQAVQLRLWVGTLGDVREHPYRAAATQRFVMVSPRGAHSKLASRDGWRPAAESAPLSEPGVHTAVFQSRHSFIKLPAKRFNHYLEEEGLDAVLTYRRLRRQDNQPGRESYFRNAKALIRVGSSSRGFNRRVGLPLEITALGDPFATGPGQPIEFVIEAKGKPLAGARIELIALTGLRVVATETSDKRGRVRIRIPSAGTWMVAATDMHRAPRGVRGEWESAWASLTFARSGS